MSALRVVDSREMMDLHLAEQTMLLMDAIQMSGRIHKAYREMKEYRINGYLTFDDEKYDFYRDAEWELFHTAFEIERQVHEQADIIEWMSCQYYNLD